MSGHYQCISRAPRSTRSNKPGHKLMQLALAARPSALYHAAVGVSLNGTDVSTLAHQLGSRPFFATAFDVTQPTAGKQPLYTGAPTFNGTPTIQFVAANADELSRAATNLGFADITGISVQRLRTPASTTFCYCNGDAGFTAGDAIGTQPGRTINQLGGVNHTDGAASAVSPEAWVFTVRRAAILPELFVNGVKLTVGGAAAANIPTTGAATLSIGSAIGSFFCDVDFMFLAWFAQYCSPNLADRIARTAAKQAGISA